MNKVLVASSLLLIFLFSCKKDEPTLFVDQSGSSAVNPHYAYFKGMLTDSLTGDPITGYNIYRNGPQADTDTLADGTYKLLRIGSKVTTAIPNLHRWKSS